MEDERPCSTSPVTVDVCTDKPCENKATCEMIGSDYKCYCVGYYGGKNCSVDFSKLLLLKAYRFVHYGQLRD